MIKILLCFFLSVILAIIIFVSYMYAIYWSCTKENGEEMSNPCTCGYDHVNDDEHRPDCGKVTRNL